MKNIIYSILRICIVKPLSKRGFGAVGWVATIYRFIMNRLIAPQEKVVSINGYKLYVHFGKHQDIGSVAQELIYDGEYEPQTTAIFKELLKPNMKVIDVGANIGYYTILASKLVGKGGKVWAFEPVQGNFDDLMRNIQLNELDNVMAIQRAVSDKEGKSTFFISELQSDQNSLVPNWAKGKSNAIEVETVILDSVINSDVDLIKTDTEGNELAVLLGATRILQSDGIKLLVEVSPQRIGMGGYTTKDLWDFIAVSGFRYIYLVDERKGKILLVNRDGLLGYKFAGNILCSKSPIKRWEK